jgi:ribosome-binding protein aMBF1 (putative translation factor)
MFHQDWEPVVLTKKKSGDLSVGPKRVLGPTHAQKLDENTENYKDHRKVPKVLADAIRQRRIELKMTQEQLAQKVNVRAGVVNDIESQRGVYEAPTVEKIKRVLGITNKILGTN